MKQTSVFTPSGSSQAAAAQSMLAAMLIIGITDNAVPLMAEQIGLGQFYLLRTIVALPFLLLMARLGLGGLLPRKLGAVTLRAVLVAIAMVLYFAAVALMPIAQALAGLFTSPIIIVIISVLFMKMQIGKIRVLAILGGFSGVLLVLQPDPANFDWLILIPVTGGFFYALGSLATGLYCQGESTVAMLFVYLLVQGLIGGVLLLGLEIWPQPVAAGADGFAARTWVWELGEISHLILLQGCAAVGGVFLVTKAYQLGEASFVSVFEYSVMVFGPGIAWAYWGQALNAWQVFGIGLIIVAGTTIALRSK